MNRDPLKNERLSTSFQEPQNILNNAKKMQFKHVIWIICYFIFYFVQQITEIFAPLLLIIGIIWKIIPHFLNSALHIADSSDLQIKEMVNHGSQLIPNVVNISGYSLDASGLIFYGILLIILSSFCAAMTAYLNYKS